MTNDTNEYRTLSMDIAASLSASGCQCFLETFDGFQVEFVFPGDANAALARSMAVQWGLGDLNADARAITVAARRIRIETRKVREQFAHERLPVRKEFKV